MRITEIFTRFGNMPAKAVLPVLALAALLLPAPCAHADAHDGKGQPPVRHAYRDGQGAALKDWKEKCREDAAKTVRGTVASTLKGITTTADLAETVRLMKRDWEDWKESKVFVLKSVADMDTYGNLLAFKVLCGTFVLAAGLWEKEDAGAAEATLGKAQWMESRAREMCSAVETIIRMQSYSEYLPQQIDIMEEEYGKLPAVFAEAAPSVLRYGAR